MNAAVIPLKNTPSPNLHHRPTAAISNNAEARTAASLGEMLDPVV
jgi:hypothetical protein